MSLIREAMKRQLLRRGMVLSRPPGQFEVAEYRLSAMVQRGLKLRAVVDGGAAEGDWARLMKRIVPDAQILAIEPRESAQSALKQLATEWRDVRIAHALLGASDELATFNESSHQSSVLNPVDGRTFGRPVKIEMARLDTLIERLDFPAPDLIKLDLQGYELHALRGADKALQTASAVVMEVSFVAFLKDLPLIDEVIPFMTQRGFRVYDIIALWHRPLDGALAQGDFVFVRDDHPLIRDSRWDRDDSGPS